MQISKINAEIFNGAKDARIAKKVIKPVANEFKPDFNQYAYSVPTGNIAENVKTIAETNVKPSNYFYYAAPSDAVARVNAVSTTEAYVKETQPIITENSAANEYKFITDSMNF